MVRVKASKGWKRFLVLAVGAGVLAAGPVGCATKTQTGALVGGAGGAAAGAAIGSASGNAGKGALIGGAIGLIGGGLIGHGMDKSDEAKEKEAQRKYEAEQRAERNSRRYSSAAAPADRVTQSDVIAWSRQGKSDDVIIDRIERSESVFRLTAADEDTLRQRGVSEDVIQAMRDTARR